ncbi:MAG: hypothetical protein DRO73_07495 [Candidatus Thorarchaeota archaeon]|nr:MAG: hypothetical protein DRO73_07495 [Candidatus Thorarchaeota archaeon]
MNVSISVVLLLLGLLHLVVGRINSSTVPWYIGTFEACLLLGNATVGVGAILLVLAIGMRISARRLSHYLSGDKITERGMMHLRSLIGGYWKRAGSGTASHTPAF